MYSWHSTVYKHLMILAQGHRGPCVLPSLAMLLAKHMTMLCRFKSQMMHMMQMMLYLRRATITFFSLFNEVIPANWGWNYILCQRHVGDACWGPVHNVFLKILEAAGAEIPGTFVAAKISPTCNKQRCTSHPSPLSCMRCQMISDQLQRIHKWPVSSQKSEQSICPKHNYM